MREKKKTAEKRNSVRRRFIIGAALLVLAVISILSYCTIFTNSVTAFIDRVQLYLFGRGTLFLPVICIILGYRAIRGERIICFNKKTLLFFLFMMCFLGTAHNLYVTGTGEELYPDRLPIGGGLIGGIVVFLLHRTIGFEWSWAFLFVGWLVFIAAVMPLGTIARRIKRLIFVSKNKYGGLEEEIEEAADGKEKPATALQWKNDSVSLGTERPNIYGNEEFKEFTEGLNGRKAFSFGKKNIYNQQAVKEGISKDPVQLPEWEENKPSVIVPIINYGSDGESMEDENKEIIKNNFQDNAIGEKPKPSAIYNAQHENITDETVLDKSVTDESRKKAVKDKEYKLPPLKILDSVKRESAASYRNEIRNKCAILEKTLADFHVRAAVSAVTRGPAVTRFELQPAPGVKVSSVTNLADDIALKLAAPSVRIEAPIPGKAAIGIEVPNSKNEQVLFREIVDCDDIRENSSKLYIGLGKDISGTIVPIDLTKMPHLLIAGSTGSGKSVCINTIIAGILYKANPNEVKFILVDPKVVELSNYDGIPHLMVPVVTDSKKAASALRWAVSEMERRYKFFADSHVREINSYNEQAKDKLPFIVIIIDELADLMAVAKADVEDAILRLAQKARAAGIHLILATQRPSVDVITGIVKANVPSRIAFAVSSQIDSRTILDMSGAEQLLGKGDMLFLPIGSNKPLRVQGAFVSDDELHRITEFIMRQEMPVNYTEEITEQALESDNKSNTSGEGGTIIDDELFEDALRLVLDLGQASASMLQRRFRVGYTRAARLVDTMEELGIVGPAAGSKPREVIMSREEVEERFLNSY